MGSVMGRDVPSVSGRKRQKGNPTMLLVGDKRDVPFVSGRTPRVPGKAHEGRPMH
jgi:hypothetical protein